MHRQVVEDLIERAHRNAELDRSVLVGIDITKSNPYRTDEKLTRDSDGNVTNDHLLGYKEEEDETADFYYQWATIQVVGLDIPLILDAVPIHRGMPRDAIVETLLESATDMLEIEMVMMDKEFGSGPVKSVCEEQGVYYLNPTRMMTNDRAQCTRLRREGKLVQIESDEPDDRGGEERDCPTRKRVFIPATNSELTSDERDDIRENGNQPINKSIKESLERQLTETIAKG